MAGGLRLDEARGVWPKNGPRLLFSIAFALFLLVGLSPKLLLERSSAGKKELAEAAEEDAPAADPVSEKGAGPGAADSEKEAKDKEKHKDKEKDKTEESKKEDPLKAIPQKDLPRQTRPKLDPAKAQYLREPVSVQFEERVKPASGEVYTPKVQVMKNYLEEYLRRAGHPIVSDAEGPSYRIEGSLQAAFHSKLIIRGQVVGFKYEGASTLQVFDRDGRGLEKFEVPRVFQQSSKGEESALLQLERYTAKVQWENLFGKGSVIGNPKIMSLINAMAIEGSDVLSEDSIEKESLTTEKIASHLADFGFEAVPYLIDALIDNRVVRLDSSYPGLKGRNLDDLRIYHIADKALEDIFQKVSRMSLDTTEAQRLRVVKGWESEWRRFCKPFRDSPQATKAQPSGEKPSHQKKGE